MSISPVGPSIGPARPLAAPARTFVSEVAPRAVAAPARALPSARPQPVGNSVADGLARVAAAQRRLDQILALAQTGRTFTPGQLIALQARVFEASQSVDVASKVVDRATGGVKQILQTQV
jgi:hypothetical protein